MGRPALLPRQHDAPAIRRHGQWHEPGFFFARNLARWSASVNGNAVDVLRSGPPGREEDLTAARSPDKIDDAIACRQAAPYVAPKLIQPDIRLSVFVRH